MRDDIEADRLPLPHQPGSPAQTERVHGVLHGSLDQAMFEQAWKYAASRHRAAHAAAAPDAAGRASESAEDVTERWLDWQDWRDRSDVRHDWQQLLAAQRDRAQPDGALLLRQVEDDTHWFSWSHSSGLLGSERMAALLHEALHGHATLLNDGCLPARLPPIARLPQPGDRDAAEHFWSGYLAGLVAPTRPAVDIARHLWRGDRGIEASLSVTLTHDDSTLVQSQCARLGISLDALAYASWARLLGAYSGEDTVLFGVVTQAKPAKIDDVSAAAEPLFDVLPLRVRIDPQQYVRDWLADVQRDLQRVQAHSSIGLARIRELSEIERGKPLFETLLSVQPNLLAMASEMHPGELRLTDADWRADVAGCPFSLRVSHGEQLRLTLDYPDHRLDAAIAGEWLQQFRLLLERLSQEAQRRLWEIETIAGPYAERALREWNATGQPFDRELTLHGMVERHAATQPELTAVVAGDGRLSYAELDARANQLAHQLIAMGVRPGDRVGLCTEKSTATVIGILGAMKAGAAYVPVDPGYPASRIAYMVEDAQLNALLSWGRGTEVTTGLAVPRLALDADWPHIAAQPTVPPGLQVSPHAFAYVIYTSGSTGQPKGVMLNHRGRVNNIEDYCRRLRLAAQDRVLCVSSLSFDISVCNIFCMFRVGGCVVFPTLEHAKNPEHWLELIDREAITFWHSAPALLDALLDAAEEQPSRRNTLRVALLGGDWIPLAQPDRARTAFPGLHFVTAGGATELSIDSTFYPVDAVDPSWRSIPYGRPLDNQSALILDPQMALVPVGVPGELYLGGEGMAAGYLRRPDLTAEKFVPHPWPARPGERLYRTGDLAKYGPDGTIELLGRIDFQVKIRGVRIELGEIEAVLREHPKVSACLAGAPPLSNGERLLAAYVVPAQPTGDDATDALLHAELRAWLSERLPGQLVPETFVTLERLPLTPNGKVDRRNLPVPTGYARTDHDYEAPQGEIEQTLAAIWQTVLHLPRVGRHDHFFSLGGHSIHAVRLFSRLSRELGVELPLAVLFEQPTLSGLASAIGLQLAEQALTPLPEIVPVTRDGRLPLSFAQQRLWFLDQLDHSGAAYHMPLALRLHGPLDNAALRRSLDRLFARHEALRTIFRAVDGQPHAELLPADGGLALIEHDLRETGNERQRLSSLCASLSQAPFDLACGPLIRAELIRVDEQQHVLLLTLHHIVSDGWSTGVLTRELGTLYAAFAEQRNDTLPPLPVQYPDHASWQRQWLVGERVKAQADYWRQRLRGAPPLLALPTDRPRPARQSFAGAQLPFLLNAELSRKLKRLSQQHGVTLFMTLMAAWAALLGRLAGQDDLVIGTPAANRGRAEIEPLIGFFVNMLALRIDLSRDPTAAELLGRVRRTALEAHAQQELPFEQVVEVVNPTRRSDCTPLFQIAFSWQNNDEGRLELPGLRVEPLPLAIAHAKFDLELSLSEQGDVIEGSIDYATALFDDASIEQLGQRFRRVLEQFAASTQVRVGDLELDPDAQLPPVVPSRLDEERAALSWHQERIWFVDTFEAGHLYPASPTYHNIALILALSGTVDPGVLQEALNTVIARHQALHTHVQNDDMRGWQVFEAAAPLTLTIVAAEAGQMIARAVEESRQPFAVGAEQALLRAVLVRSDEQHSILGVTAHHLIADRESMRLLASELFEIYAAKKACRTPTLPQLTTQYADHVAWQHQLPADTQASLRAYWKYRLAGKLQAMELPLKQPRMAVHLFSEARHEFRLSKSLGDRLRVVAQNSGVSAFDVFFAVFNALMRRYSGHEELIVGTSVNCRDESSTAHLIGPIANLLVLRSFIDASTTFDALMQQARLTVAQASRHQHMQFDQLVLALNPDKDMSRTALFDVLFQLDEREPQTLQADELSIQTIETNLGYGKNDLHLLMHAEAGQWSGKVVYNELFFDAWFIEQMMAHYRLLLEALADDGSQRIDEVPLLEPTDEQRQLHGWNERAATYPEQLTVHQLFEAQVERTPDRIAVSLDGQRLSYRELNQRANRLAHCLRASGTQPQELVALLLDRSPEMIVAILAVMKAGAAYVPIDPQAPVERIRYILQDCGARRAIVSPQLPGTLPELDIEIIALGDSSTDFPDYPLSNPANVNAADHLVYVIYTSGSTGQPKGALLEHRNVVQLLCNDRAPFAFGADDVWSMFHSYAFDFSVWEMYGALLYGGRIAIVPETMRKDPSAFLAFIAEERISVLNQTPSAFYALSAAAAQTDLRLPDLRYVIFGGESLDPAQLKAFRKTYPHVALVNMYGITETCVHVTFKQLDEDAIDSGLSNVGHPLPTTTAYIMDAAQRLLPAGVPGEICVGGHGVGRGYLNRPELSAQRFVTNPYLPQERLYRSGDLGKLLESGEIVHLGRMDDQVKIRGFRIELGEIEAALRDLPGITQAAVIAREDKPGHRQLIGYVVAAPGHTPEPAELCRALATRLPDYMLPVAVMVLAALPLTINGKLDQQALPAPDFGRHDSRQPRTPQEAALSGLFADVLGLERVSIDDNFFDLGGHSLLATRLIGLIRHALNAEIPIRTLFESPTVASLTEQVNQAPRSVRMPLRPRRPHELQP